MNRNELLLKNERLKENLLSMMPEPGRLSTSIKGLSLYRWDDIRKLENCIAEPTVAVIVQGRKTTVVGKEECHYTQLNYLVTGIDIPAMSCITEAESDRPFLGLSLRLDPCLIAALITETPLSQQLMTSAYKSVAIGNMDMDLLDAFFRLTELLKVPEKALVLSTLVVREIYYLLLMGPLGNSLRAINTLGSRSNQIAKAVAWLRENYKKPLHVETLAKRVNMSTSTFHKHFKQITTLSPLQYQKRLRLHEAQRLMLVEHEHAVNAGLAVGYQSPTQFNREYKRHFGEPPLRNIAKTRHIIL